MLFEKDIESYSPQPQLESSNSGRIILNGKEVINLSSNNYLGLVDHPDVIDAAILAIKKYGVGAASARNIIGNFDLYDTLEKKLADFKGEEAAVVFQGGYVTNLGLIPLIVDKGDLVLSDELNHASIIDGIRMCKADKKVFKHMDMADLENILKEGRKKYRRVLITTDTVFSMDGDIAPLDQIVKLAKEYDALTYFDDAHGTGVMGKNGKGTVDEFGLTGQVDFTIATISKAIPSVGGYVVGSRAMREWVMRNARPILFSTCIPPSSLAAAIKMVEMLSSSSKYVDQLWENTNYFKTKLKEKNIDIGNSKTPITPVIIGEEDRTRKFSKDLLEKGIIASPIVFPVVPRGKGRVRCIITAGHTKDELDYCIDTIVNLYQSYQNAD